MTFGEFIFVTAAPCAVAVIGWLMSRDGARGIRRP